MPKHSKHSFIKNIQKHNFANLAIGDDDDDDDQLTLVDPATDLPDKKPDTPKTNSTKDLVQTKSKFSSLAEDDEESDSEQDGDSDSETDSDSKQNKTQSLVVKDDDSDSDSDSDSDEDDKLQKKLQEIEHKKSEIALMEKKLD